MVYGLAYSSQALADFDDETLLELAYNAAAKNETLGISGYLFYRDGLFLQYLEGELMFILETTAKAHYSSDEVADAILHVTQCIARLDW